MPRRGLPHARRRSIWLQPEWAEEQRSRRRTRKSEHARRTALPAELLVVELEGAEDAEASGALRCHRVHGVLAETLLATDPEPRQRVRRNPDDVAVDRGNGHQAARGVPVEPPVEHLAAHSAVAPGLPHETEIRLTMARLVRFDRE